MTIYYTAEQPQQKSNAQASLGGFVSSTPVPNNREDNLFNATYQQPQETRQYKAVALRNTFNTAVSDVLVGIENHESEMQYRIAAVAYDEQCGVERLLSSSDEPVYAEFYEASVFLGQESFPILFSSLFQGTQQVVNLTVNGTVMQIQYTPGAEEAWLKKAAAMAQQVAVTKRVTYAMEPARLVFESKELYDQVQTEVLLNGSRVQRNETPQIDNTIKVAETLQPGGTVVLWIEQTAPAIAADVDELYQRFQAGQAAPVTKGAFAIYVQFSS